jgi:methylase of polypeptide subunit release factors
VFFGPDTYRFCNLLSRSVPRCFRLVDLGCGAGAGGLSVASSAERVVLSDVSPKALRFAAVNAVLAGVEVELAESDGLASVGDPIDVIVCNPPYLRDAGGRVYRDGGGDYGEGLGLRFLRESLERLTAGGTLVLYTGAPIVEGRDVFWQAARALCERPGLRVTYEELDPDVFGEELASPPYQDVDRIAAVGLIVQVLRDDP